MDYSIKPSEKIAFSLIASLAFTENLIFAIVSLKNYWMLKVPYHALVFSLVITDLLTGISLVITPAYILGNNLPFPDGRTSGALFCYLLYSHFIPFALGSVSLFTIALLAVERWFAVIAPFTYRRSFRQPRKMLLRIIFVWILGFLVTGILFTDVKYDYEHAELSKRCTFRGLRKTADNRINPVEVILAVLDFLRFLIPFTISVVSFTSLYKHFKNYSASIQSSTTTERDAALRMVCNMAAIAALVMTFCWLPTHVTFFMYKIGVGGVELQSWYHRITVILCMSNACINPLIYLCTNKVYRQEFIEFFTCRDLGLRQAFKRLHETTTSNSESC